MSKKVCWTVVHFNFLFENKSFQRCFMWNMSNKSPFRTLWLMLKEQFMHWTRLKTSSKLTHLQHTTWRTFQKLQICSPFPTSSFSKLFHYFMKVQNLCLLFRKWVIQLTTKWVTTVSSIKWQHEFKIPFSFNQTNDIWYTKWKKKRKYVTYSL